jgi:hypothetical protein
MVPSAYVYLAATFVTSCMQADISVISGFRRDVDEICDIIPRPVVLL